MNMKTRLYKYDSSNLGYKRVSVSYKKIIYFILVQIVISIGLIFLLSNFFNTPKESKLKEENNRLQYELYTIDKKIDGVYYFLQLLDQKDSVINSIYFADTFDLPTPLSVSEKIDNIGEILKYDNIKFQNVIKELTANNDKLRHYPAIQPISKKDLLYISSGYSMRIHPIYNIRKFHFGMDFVTEVGSPVYATADGIITIAKDYLGYGNFVKIDHGYDYQTAYGHLDNIGVKKGQRVVRGQIIGTVGNTGISTGPHLHYEVLFQNKPVNPINFYSQDITLDEFDRMLKAQKELRVGMD